MVLRSMTSLTIRELRQSWPAAERALEEESEIVITRDGKPVAKLVRYSESKKRRPRFDPEKHFAKMLKIQGGKLLPSIDPIIAADRAD
jgi:antitoxin (DNA-binding transcriptional repressor) of toxin-antitoxin stability system